MTLLLQSSPLRDTGETMTAHDDAPDAPNGDLQGLCDELRALRRRIGEAVQRASKQPARVPSVDVIRREALALAFDLARATDTCGDTAKEAIGLAWNGVAPSSFDGPEATHSQLAIDAERVRFMLQSYADLYVTLESCKLLPRDKSEVLASNYKLLRGNHATSNFALKVERLHNVIDGSLAMFTERDALPTSASAIAQATSALLAHELGPSFGSELVRAEIERVLVDSEAPAVEKNSPARSNPVVRVWRAALKENSLGVDEDLRLDDVAKRYHAWHSKSKRRK